MIDRIKRHIGRGVVLTTGSRPSFRQRYQDIEARRTALLKRLTLLNGGAQSHQAYGRVLTLLNRTFRKAKVAQRLAIPQSAEWLIDVLEALTLIA
jgi:hypothetical protein